ncbi:MAG: hypothetical protein MZW92_78650 [Comamonadaceae bacterium]|nr:hypothetical protein [Comamonadaceae bacterium]
MSSSTSASWKRSNPGSTRARGISCTTSACASRTSGHCSGTCIALGLSSLGVLEPHVLASAERGDRQPRATGRLEKPALRHIRPWTSAPDPCCCATMRDYSSGPTRRRPLGTDHGHDAFGSRGPISNCSSICCGPAWT